MSSLFFPDTIISFLEALQLAKDGYEPVGVFRATQSFGEGLLQIKIRGLQRCVLEEFRVQLDFLQCRGISFFRTHRQYMIAEVPS